MKLKTLRNSIFFIALLFFVGGVGYRLGEKNFFSPAVEPSIIGAARTIVGQDSPPDLRSVDFSEFWQVWQSLQDKYYDKSKLTPKRWFMELFLAWWHRSKTRGHSFYRPRIIRGPKKT